MINRITGRFREQQLTNVPEHWAIMKLGNVLKLHYGRRLDETLRSPEPTDTHHFPVYSSGGHFGYTNKAIVKTTPSIVLGRVGTVGRPKLIQKPYFPIDTTFHVSTKHNIKYIHYLLSTIDYQYYAEYTVIPAIRRGTLYRIEVGLPPRDEQDRIAEKLESLIPT
jgi:type I restriction enzyme S subunit